jgi:hypothetical protein
VCGLGTTSIILEARVALLPFLACVLRGVCFALEGDVCFALEGDLLLTLLDLGGLLARLSILCSRAVARALLGVALVVVGCWLRVMAINVTRLVLKGGKGIGPDLPFFDSTATLTRTI